MDNQPTIIKPENSPDSPAQPNSSPAPQIERSDVILSHNTANLHKDANRQKTMLLGLAGAALSLIVILLIYFFVLPPIWANSYKKNVKPAYETQVSQIKAVYASLASPVFTSNQTSNSINNQELAYISGVINTANKNLAALKAKDHLTLLPGTTWSSTVSSARAEHLSMQQYISDSQNFLDNYKQLVSYIQNLTKAGTADLNTISADFNSVEANAHTNATALLSSVNKTISDLQTFVSTVKAVKPSSDLVQFNQDLLNDLNGMSDGLQGLVSLLQGQAPGQTVLNSIGELQTSAFDFSALADSNPTANLSTNSDLHNQVLTLQSEHPIN